MHTTIIEENFFAAMELLAKMQNVFGGSARYLLELEAVSADDIEKARHDFKKQIDEKPAYMKEMLGESFEFFNSYASPSEVQVSCNWLVKIIECSTTEFHFHCIDNLINLFKIKYPADSLLILRVEDARADQLDKVKEVLV